MAVIPAKAGIQLEVRLIGAAILGQTDLYKAVAPLLPRGFPLSRE